MESSFSESRSERSRKAFLRVLPPRRHIVAIVTGGLKRLYSRIRENKEISHNEVGKFTDKLGRFQPPEGLMLASRYHVLSILPSWGQSAMLIRAQDVVRNNMMVMIKALHSSQLYFEIGFQEAHMLRRLACADPHGFSHTVRLLNMFLYDHHFCLVFELLDPRPITHALDSLNLSHKEKLKVLRKVTLQLLQVIGFLQQNNTIHADLKPENILLDDVHDASSLRVIDFGNAINHVHREMSLYYRDFQVQTLLYRAPEVVFGIPFGAEIDMWSVGCILAEIYLGKPLISGTDRITLVQSMMDVLGPLPHQLFQRGKYFEHLESFATKDSGQSDVTFRLMARFQRRTQPDFTFANLLSGLLCYDPDKRLTPAQAAQHPFLAPEVCISYLRSDSGSQHETISTVFLSHEDYKNRPQIAVEICRQGPSSTDLLRMGTNKHHKDSPKQFASLMSPSENHTCVASHLHESSCKLQSKGQHSSSGERKDMCLNIASVPVCAHLRESHTTCTHPQGSESQGQITCTQPQDRGSQGEVSRTSQARKSAVVLCQSPDTTCVMEISQVMTHDDQQHSQYCVLYNKSPETDVKGFQHCAQQHSQNNICRTLEPQVSTSSKRVYGKLQEMHITSQNKSLAADSSAKGLLLHKPASSFSYSTERESKECGSSNSLAENSPCPQDLGCKKGLVMSPEHRDHSCKSSCVCEDAENPVQSRSLNETFTIKDISLDEDDVLGVDMNFPEISASLMQVGSPNRSSPSKTEVWCQSEAAEDCPGPKNTCILGFSKTSPVELLSGMETRCSKTSPVELLSGMESRCCKSEFLSSVSYNIHDVSLVQSDSVGHCRAALTLDGEVGLKCGKTTKKNDYAQVKDIQLHSLSSSTVDSFNSKNLGMSCADVTFDSDCSNDSSHEKFRNFIDTVSRDTPLAQKFPAWDQTSRQHRMQADSVSHTQVNIIPHSSIESTAGCTALFSDGQPDDLNVNSFVHPSRCLWRKSNSAKKVRSETSKVNKNAQNVLPGVGQRACSISSSLAGDVGHDQEAEEGHHRTAVVTIGKIILSDSSSKLKPLRRRNLFGVCKKTKGSKKIKVDAFAEENGTSTCGMTPSHQDGTTRDGTLLLPQDPYLQRTKSRVCQDLSPSRIIIPEKNERRYFARYKSKEVSNSLLTQAVRQFLPKIRSPQGVLAKTKGQLAPTFDQELLSPGQFREREFLPRSSKVTKYTQAQDKVTSCDNIQISRMLPCNGKQGFFLGEQNRKRKCKHDVGMLGDLPWGSTVPNFSVSKTEITEPISSEGETERGISGPFFSEGETERCISGCNFSVGKAATDISQSVYSSSVQVNPDLGFSNNSNLDENRMKKVVPSDSLPDLKLGANHLKSSLVGRKSDTGRISLAIATRHTIHRDPPVQTAATEEANQHLRSPDDAVDEMCNIRQRHKDKPRKTLEMPDDGDDDVIMLIQ